MRRLMGTGEMPVCSVSYQDRIPSRNIVIGKERPRRTRILSRLELGVPYNLLAYLREIIKLLSRTVQKLAPFVWIRGGIARRGGRGISVWFGSRSLGSRVSLLRSRSVDKLEDERSPSDDAGCNAPSV
jgi:hypothetical protein